MPASDFYPVCPVACINNGRLDLRCRKRAPVLADKLPLHRLFPCLCKAGNVSVEGGLCWQLHAHRVEQHNNLSWVFMHICLKKHKYVVCSMHSPDHLQLSFHWLHQGRKTARSTGYTRSLKNLEVSITKKSISVDLTGIDSFAGPFYLPDMSRTLRKRSSINPKVSI